MAYQGPPPGYDDGYDQGGHGGYPPQGYGPPPGQGYGPPPGPGYYPPYGPPPQNSMLPMAGGICCVLGGIFGMGYGALYLALGSSYSAYFDTGILMICGALMLIFGIMGMLGGVLAIQKKNWAFALICGILGIFSGGPVFLGSILCLIGVILIAVSRDSFR